MCPLQLLLHELEAIPCCVALHAYQDTVIAVTPVTAEAAKVIR